MYLIKIIFSLISLIFSLNLYAAEPKEIPNNQSNIILHDGMFEGGLPNRFLLDASTKTSKWGYGNWGSNDGYANIGFDQMGPEWILHEKGMIAKKVLKGWGVEDYKLGKKKGFKSSGNRSLVQLVEIDNQKCAVIISKFGSSRDAHKRLRSSISGFVCVNSGEFTIDDAINFMHCVELKGEGTNYIGKEIDDKCIKQKKDAKVENKTINNDENNSEGIESTTTNSDQDTVVEKLEKLKNLYDQKLITKEEYDAKRKEILDEM
tara:strand:- start:253 stop:1038 length:786 start_codon:yes stop_codon:yes gene_type:complete